MDRINTATKAVDLFGAGKHGFKDGNLALAIQPTDLEAAFFNDLQEEFVGGLIEYAGLAPTAGVRNQIRQAIEVLIARATGNDYKPSVRVATTAAINLAAPGASIDGTAMAVGDRFLDKDNATPALRGIYIWNGAAVPATRAGDADGAGEITPGMKVEVEEGATLADSTWGLATDGVITLGTTPLSFTRRDSGALQASAAEITAETAVLKFISPDSLANSKRVAKAWAHVNAAGTIVTSFGVSSVTKNTTGSFTINWTTAQPNANYLPFISQRPSAATYGPASLTHQVHPSTAPTTTAVTVWFTYQDDNNNNVYPVDPLDFYVVIFGD
jgi:hypothetical protein